MPPLGHVSEYAVVYSIMPFYTICVCLGNNFFHASLLSCIFECHRHTIRHYQKRHRCHKTKTFQGSHNFWWHSIEDGNEPNMNIIVDWSGGDQRFLLNRLKSFSWMTNFKGIRILWARVKVKSTFSIFKTLLFNTSQVCIETFFQKIVGTKDMPYRILTEFGWGGPNFVNPGQILLVYGTIYSKTRLEYRTHQTLSIDATMTSTLHWSDKV